jgi:hypothetical protein
VLLCFADHRQTTCFLLRHLSAHPWRQYPRASFGCLSKCQHSQPVTFIPRRLTFLEQNVALHRPITGFLCPLGRAVMPPTGKVGAVRVPIEPSGELGTAGANDQEAAPGVRLHLPSLLLNDG